MDDDSVKTRLTVVGLGGIGSNLVELLVPALEKIGVAIEISLMDGDIVEEHNLGHQRYSSKDVGEQKVMCLTRRFENLSNYTINLQRRNVGYEYRITGSVQFPSLPLCNESENGNSQNKLSLPEQRGCTARQTSTHDGNLTKGDSSSFATCRWHGY